MSKNANSRQKARGQIFQENANPINRQTDNCNLDNL